MYVNQVSSKSHTFHSWIKEVASPTAVEASVYCHFVHSHKKSIVTIGGTRLCVYDIEETKGPTDNVLPSSKPCLSYCLGENFYDEVYDMATIRFVGDHLDSVVVSFREAKYSVLRFDPALREIQTVSIHNYEYEIFKKGQLTFANGPLVRTDVDNRCAAGLVYDHHLVVFPVRRDITMGANFIGGSKNFNMLPAAGTSGLSMLGGFAPSYTLDLRTVDRIHTVIDMQFLHGYYHPTLLVLFETIGTWAGRVTARSDTCVISAISLNMQERTSPIVWTVHNLPYNSFRLLPIPRPICGVVLMTVNAFIYLNQSQPACALAVNSFAQEFTHYRTRLSKGPYLSLDCSRAAVLNDCGQVLVVLRQGEMFVFTLLLDVTMKVVSDVRYDPVGSTVPPTSVNVCGKRGLFVGSRLSDSQLLSMMTQSTSYPKVDKAVTETMTKTIDDVGLSSSTPTEELDEIYGYYNTHQAKETIAIYEYSFEAMDHVLNWAPIGRLTTGEIFGWSNIFPEHPPHTDFSQVELVSSSGWSKTGGLTLLQKTLRPRIRSTFELTGFTRIWTVSGGNSVKSNSYVDKMDASRNKTTTMDATENHDSPHEVSASDENATSDPQITAISNGPVHNYIILSRQDSTMVLEVEQELVEVAHCGFSTTEPTLLVGNMGHVYGAAPPYIVQVLPNSVRLLCQAELMECLTLDSDWSVKWAVLQDPYVLLLMEDEEIFLLHLKDPNRAASTHRRFFTKSKPKFGSNCIVQACCMYRDTSGYLNCILGNRPSIPTTSEAHQQLAMSGTMSVADFSQRRFDTIEDEDLLLYGKIIVESKDDTTGEHGMDVENATAAAAGGGFNSTHTTVGATGDGAALTSEVQTWAFIVSSDNKLHLVTLPDFTVRYTVSNILECDSVFVEDVDFSNSSDAMDREDAQNPTNYDEEDAPPPIQEILVVSSGQKDDTPLLLIRTPHEVILYQAFIYNLPGLVSYAQLRWRRLSEPWCLLKAPRRIGGDPKYEEVHKEFSQRQRMSYFETIGTPPHSHRGVFISGSHPHWIFLSRQGHIRAFPMFVDGIVTDFHPFHNLNCDHGFAYLNHVGELRLSTLFDGYSYEHELGVRRVHIGRTVHFVQYHVVTKTYVVVSSEEVATPSIFKLSVDGDKEEEFFNRDASFVQPLVPHYALQLFSPHDAWQEVLHSRVVMEPWERLLCLDTVQLSSQETMRGLKDYLVGGSNLCYGEEIPVRGKILIVDVIDVVPEPGQPLTRFKLKVLYHEEQKGPVTAVCSCQGFLVTAIGQKIYIWSLKDHDLVGVAFVDSDIYIHSLCSVKNLILAADMLKSVSLLRFQVSLRVLSRVCRDINQRRVHAANYFIDGKTLAFCATDNENNVLLFTYDPLESVSGGGSAAPQHKYVQRLIRASDTRLPLRVNHSLRIRNALRDPVLVSRDFSLVDQEATRQSLYFGSVEGSLYRLSPLRDKVMSRLGIIEKNLTQALAHLAGLHPVAARQYRYSQPELAGPCGGIANGDLLWRYLALPHSQRVEVAKKSGLTMEAVLDDIVELSLGSLHF